MTVNSGAAFVQRYRRWLILLLVMLPLGVLLAVVVTAYARGIRVQGPGWQDGLELRQWQWLQNGCVKARGEGLRVTGWRPVTITMASVQ